MMHWKGRGSDHNLQGRQSKENLSSLYFEVLSQHLVSGTEEITTLQ
jgi:hypothetical protein